MDESRFAAALERAQQLMNDSTFNSLVEKKSGNVSFSPNDDIIKENAKGSSHENFMSEIAAIKETGINNILETVKNRQIGDNSLSTTPNVIERLVSKNTINPKTVTENILPNNYIKINFSKDENNDSIRVLNFKAYGERLNQIIDNIK